VIRVSGAPEAAPHLALPELLTLPAITGGRAVDAGFELRVQSVQSALPPLLALAESRGVAWSEISTHSATLEDVFVSLTGRDLRDS
jgi:ABC-2 type transport system ATP-binding protein